MRDEDVAGAAALFVEARRTGRLIDALPAACRPAGTAEAHRIQDATVAALGERVAGWKVGAASDGTVMRGAILESRVFASPATVPARLCPLMGVEPEIAFRLERPLPPREAPYDRGEVAAAVTAFPAIEIVDSRFAGYPDLAEHDRTADCASNGGFVAGSPIPGWRALDLVRLAVRVTVGDDVLADVVGGHPRGDPLLPAVDLVNELRHGPGIEAGRVVTTGSYCGLLRARAGVPVVCAFAGIGVVGLRFAA